MIEIRGAGLRPCIVCPAGVEDETVKDGQQNGSWIHAIMEIRVLTGACLYMSGQDRPSWYYRFCQVGKHGNDRISSCPARKQTGMNGLTVCIRKTMVYKRFFDPVNWSANPVAPIIPTRQTDCQNQ